MDIIHLFLFSSLEDNLSFETQDVESTYIREQLQSKLV